MVQLMIDKKLLKAVDSTSKRTKRNRSTLVRDALRDHLQRDLLASEERDRQGYARQTQADAETKAWESEAAWPGY